MPAIPYVPPEYSIRSVDGEPWVRQGDIYRDVEYIESLNEDSDGSTFSISKLIFPLALVLGQDCDLLSDGALKNPSLPPGRKRPSNSSAALITVLMTPLYNSEEFFAGNHCSDLIESLFLSTSTVAVPGPIRSTPIHMNSREPIMKGENARFQYMHFNARDPLVDCVIDFKHYFSVKMEYLVSNRRQCFGRIDVPFRESISQRFGYFLSRIGLPEG
jgi:hypothetical protein